MSVRAELKIPEKYKNKRLWSFSKINEYRNCSYGYFLDRIKRVPKHENIYSILGTLAHDINEAYYTQNISSQQMIDMFDEGIQSIKMGKYRFASDPEKNTKMFDKYYSCVKHFYENFQPVNAKVIREKEVYTDVNGNVLLGYIDQLHKEDGILIITDDKTSSIYDKKKIEKEKAQLINYALAIIQQGFPMDKIKLRWNFIKYANVSFMQKNGKEKIGKYERYEIVKKIQANLRMRLRDMNFSEAEIDEKVNLALETNSLDFMPEGIQKAYKITNCYVYIDLNQEVINEFKEEISSVIKEIEEKEAIGEIEFERDKIQETDVYWCSVLCGVNNHCKYYKQYLDDINMFRTEENKEENMYGENKSISLDDEIAALLEML